MMIDYIRVGPDVVSNFINRVIFLSDSKYYFQTNTAQLFNGVTGSSSFSIGLTNKGVIYSSD